MTSLEPRTANRACGGRAGGGQRERDREAGGGVSQDESESGRSRGYSWRGERGAGTAAADEEEEEEERGIWPAPGSGVLQDGGLPLPGRLSVRTWRQIKAGSRLLTRTECNPGLPAGGDGPCALLFFSTLKGPSEVSLPYGVHFPLVKEVLLQTKELTKLLRILAWTQGAAWC